MLHHHTKLYLCGQAGQKDGVPLPIIAKKHRGATIEFNLRVGYFDFDGLY